MAQAGAAAWASAALGGEPAPIRSHMNRPASLHQPQDFKESMNHRTRRLGKRPRKLRPYLRAGPLNDRAPRPGGAGCRRAPAGGWGPGSTCSQGCCARAPENSRSFGKSVAACGPAGHTQDRGCGNPRSWAFESGAPGDQDTQQAA